MRLRALVLCAFFVLSAVVACSSGNSGGGVGDAGACGGFGAPTVPACNACFTASCCDEGVKCDDNPDCLTAFACIQACSDSACVTSCLTENPNGLTDVNALLQCADTDCGSECGTTTPPDGSTFVPPDSSVNCGYTAQDPACTACLETSCCGQASTCATDPTCADLFSCVQACSDQNCEDNCDAMYAGAEAELDAFLSCVNGDCAAQCNGSGVDGGVEGGTPPPTDGGPACGGYGAQNPTCNTCLDDSCCAQAAACGAIDDCNSLFDCVETTCASGDATCIGTCETNYPNGLNAYQAFIGCLSQDCTSACASAPDAGGTPDATLPPADADEDAGAPVDAADGG